MDETKARIAHLLRRTGFGPHPGQVESLAGSGVAGALDAVLGAPAIQPDPPGLGTKNDEPLLVEWWRTVIARPEAGLHEKMVWYWHSHLTSSLDKTEPLAMLRQHQLLRKHALGNFRTMLQEVTIDAAMLQWLDGDGSVAEAPNENYGRELMELFTLGHDGGYTEGDVRSAAHALSGWSVDDKTLKVSYDAEKGPNAAVKLLGRDVREAADVIDAVCDHEACAPFVVGKLYRYFHGVAPDPGTLGSLATLFRSSKLEIAPLVAAILRDAAFFDHRLNRPRYPIEWFTAANVVLGIGAGDAKDDVLETLGQVPFNPPNVAGWPGGPRWLSAGAAMARAQYAWDAAGDSEVVSTADPVGTILEKASLYEVSDATADGLRRAAGKVEGRRDRATVLHALVVNTPEFLLA